MRMSFKTKTVSKFSSLPGLGLLTLKDSFFYQFLNFLKFKILNSLILLRIVGLINIYLPFPEPYKIHYSKY
jgi:hypothetical protein